MVGNGSLDCILLPVRTFAPRASESQDPAEHYVKPSMHVLAFGGEDVLRASIHGRRGVQGRGNGSVQAARRHLGHRVGG
eukprot:10040852-Alexandrium_andersonii.AAC.1